MRVQLFLLVLLVSPWGWAESPHQCAPDGVAVGGYDLVSYHAQGGPRAGSPEHSAMHQELRYQFANAENLRAFQAEPERYLPVYQGWCAATLAMGRLACPDYTNFKLEDGRLLLFELAGFTNGRAVWDSDPENFRRRADTNAEVLLSR